MKEVEIKSWCDNHGDDKVESEAEHTIMIDGRPMTLDLCGPCALTLLLPVHALLAERGVPVGDPPKAPAATAKVKRPKDHLCPECGEGAVSRGALGQHLHTYHKKGFRDFPELDTPRSPPRT